ncbi:pentatricopeptide repeat-containing protein [Tanacetum coccineum]
MKDVVQALKLQLFVLTIKLKDCINPGCLGLRLEQLMECRKYFKGQGFDIPYGSVCYVFDRWYCSEMTPAENTLVDVQNSDGSTPLHVAAIVGNTEAAKIFWFLDKRLKNCGAEETCMAPSDSLFLIFDVHYDGTFNFCPLTFDNGLVYQWFVRKDNPLDIASVREFLREKTQSVIVYELFFKLPQCDLDVGLKIIKNERDLEAMYDYALEFGIIHVYITHGPQDLAPYYVENMCFYGSEDDLKPRKIVTKDAGNMSLEELVNWAEEEAAMSNKASDVDICMTSKLDKGKGLADKGKWLADKGKGLADKDWKEMFKGISDSESEYSDKSVDYLSEGEDELISLRKRFSEAKNPNHSNKNSNTNVAGRSRPNRVYGVGETATIIEHEEYMDILMHQLRGKSDGLSNPFTILENDQSNERYPIHDDQTHWKMRKPKYVDAAQLKECLTYYSLANGFSLWFYRSSKEMIIARSNDVTGSSKTNDQS